MAGPGPSMGPPQRTFSELDRVSVVGICSGKGGVGKSTTTTNLAAALASRGHKVGVMDADIWGFSIPRMFGLRGQRPEPFDDKIAPLERDGVKIISIGFFLDREEESVVWRGPMLHKAIEQFLGDVHWGDIEYLLIDLPPGTGDISISLVTFVPEMGAVVVTTPQPVAQKVAERAGNMFLEKAKLKVLGVVENMSGEVFGEGGGQELADRFAVPLLASIPLDPQLREASDAGIPFVWSNPDHPISQQFLSAADQLTRFRPRRRLQISPR